MGELNEETFHRHMVENQLKGTTRLWPHVWGRIPDMRVLQPGWKSRAYGEHNQHLFIGRRDTPGCAVVNRESKGFPHILRVRIYCLKPEDVVVSIQSSYNPLPPCSSVDLTVCDEPGYGYNIARHIESSGLISITHREVGEWDALTDVRLADMKGTEIPRYVRPAVAVWDTEKDGIGPLPHEKMLVGI